MILNASFAQPGARPSTRAAETFVLRALNINQTGALVETLVPLSIGDVLRVDFPLGDAGQREVIARVVHLHSHCEGRCSVGLVFINQAEAA